MPINRHAYTKISATYPLCYTGNGGYRFGFNGQEKDNEITGVQGSHNTAEFWMYDTRLGRRWNVDPVDQISISNYVCFRNNPIFIVDKNGDKPEPGLTRQESKSVRKFWRKEEMLSRKLGMEKGSEGLRNFLHEEYKDEKWYYSPVKDKTAHNDWGGANAGRSYYSAIGLAKFTELITNRDANSVDYPALTPMVNIPLSSFEGMPGGGGSMLYSGGPISGNGQVRVNATFEGSRGSTSVSIHQGDNIFSENQKIKDGQLSPTGISSLVVNVNSGLGNHLTLRISSSVDVAGVNIKVQATAGMFPNTVVRSINAKHLPTPIYVVGSNRLDKKTIRYLKDWN